MSRPWRSISGVIRSPIVARTTNAIAEVPINAKAMVMAIAFSCSSQSMCPTIFASPFWLAAVPARLELTVTVASNREKRAQGSAHGVHSESIERIIVVKP